MNELVQIQELLKEKAACQARLNLMPYDGSPEIVVFVLHEDEDIYRWK